MSADDFQTKYASVMESMLKNAVAETTKLFEKMVDELKVEISNIRKENEDLKTRCSKFENAESRPVVDNGENYCPPAQCNDRTRDSAVQCDLVPLNTVLVEQYEPLSHVSLHNQEQNHAHDEMEYSLQEQMGTVAFKQEALSNFSLQCVLEQEDVETPVFCDRAGTPQPPVSGTVNEEPPIIRECSREEMTSSQKDNVTHLVMGNRTQDDQNWSHDPEPSYVISLASVNENTEEVVGEKMPAERTTPEKLMPEQHQGQMSGNGQTEVNEQQCTGAHLGESNNKKVGNEGRSNLKLTVRRIRGRPQKRIEQKEVCQSLSVDVPKNISSSADTVNISSSKFKVHPKETSSAFTQPVENKVNGQPSSCLSKHQKSESEQPSVEEETVKGLLSDISSESETSVQLNQRRNSVTLQDALLLVEAMNQSTAEMVGPVQTQNTPCVDTSEMPDKVPAETIPLIPAEAVDTSDVTPHIYQSLVAETETAAQCLPHPVTTTVANTKLGNKGCHRIIIVPRSSTRKITAHHAFVSLTAPKNNGTPPASTVAKSSPGMPPCSSASQKTIIVPTISLPIVHYPVTTTSENSPQQKIKVIIPRWSSAVTLQKCQSQINCPTEKQSAASDSQVVSDSMADSASSTSTYSLAASASSDSEVASSSSDCQVASASPDFPSIPAASGSPAASASSGSPAASASPGSPAAPATPVTSLTSELSSQSQESNVSATELPQNTENITDSAESQSHETDICSELKTSAVPSVLPVVQQNVGQKLSAVVRITRLPFPISTQESISVSKLLLNDVSYKYDTQVRSLHLTISCSEVATDKASEPTPLAKKECQETQTVNTTQLTKSKDTSGTCLQMESPFLVSQGVQSSNKTISDDCPDVGSSCIQTSMCDRRSLKMNSLVSRLRSHLKTHLQTRRSKTFTEKENTTLSSCESQLDGDGESDDNIMSPRKVARYSRSLAAGDSTPVTPKRSTKESTSPQMTNLTSLSPRRSCRESNAVRTKESRKTPLYSGSPQRSSRLHGSPFGTSLDMSGRLRSSSLTNYGPIRRRLTNQETPSMQSSQQDRRCRSSTRLIQEGHENSHKVAKAQKVDKAARGKMIPRIQCSNAEKLQTDLAKKGESCKVGKRCKTAGVWIPPTWEECKDEIEKEKEAKLAAKNEPLPHPVIIKPGPFVSPLQPLSVIGRHLLRNQCGECGRLFNNAAALESHVSLHTGRQPLTCLLCGKTFPDLKSLKRHGRVHNYSTVYKCPQCGKGFIYKFGLNKHIQMVHGRVKPFNCHICNKAFFANRDVVVHMRSHTGERPFPCNLCERKFARRVELNLHLRWHNGEKRHWCSYCGKGFLDYNNLKRHRYIHTGEKPHPCPHCPKHFTQSGHLKKHVKNVHKVK